MSTFHSRLAKVQQQLISDGLDAVLIMSPAATTYLSGCYLLTQTVIPKREAYVLVTGSGHASYLVCNIEEKMAREDSWIEDLHTYVEFKEEPATAVSRLLHQHNLTHARVGIETHTLPTASAQLLRDALPFCTFSSWDTPMAEIMMIKEPEEVAAIETAGRLTLRAITHALTHAAPGSSERAVFTAMMTEMMSHGLYPMFNVFTSGPNTLLVHGEPGSRSLQPGDLIRLDVGGRWPSHYLSDMARTAVVAAPAPQQADNYRKLYNAQMETIEAVRPGIPISDLYHVCAASYGRQNIPFSMPHIGHSMGIGLHEHPLIHPGETTLIQPGMVLNIEPFLADPVRGEGYHIEDLVVVTDTSYRLLTDPTPELIVVPG
ncbi:MAG: aminopeptidase P family protein [Ardenticatenaceae bacterium]|nr:aminopeptidase P family protein [Ardenticatenaceae bacterium]